MNNKMTVNTYLLTIESTNKMNSQNRNRLKDTDNFLLVARWEWGWRGG